MKDRIAKTVSLTSVLVLVFLYGAISTYFGWFPANYLLPAFEQLGSVTQSESGALHNEYPARYDLRGTLAYRGDGSFEPPAQPEDSPGVTLLTSHWLDHDWMPGIRVIDASGQVLHEWPLDIPKLWPESPYQDPSSNLRNIPDNYVHGCHLFPNGDVLFSIEFMGLVRMNARGEVVWKLNRRTHHALHPTEDGNFWVCAANWLDEAQVRHRFPELGQTLWEDCVLLVSPQGEVLKEVSILGLIYNSRQRSLLWHSQARGPSLSLLHLNDVEPLPAKMADQYPMFEAGDLMVSMREVHLVCVFNPDNLRMKWVAPSVFTMQHDPDFIGDGWISVYDNNPDGSVDGSVRGGSRLLAIRPETGQIRPIYTNAAGPDQRSGRRFFSHLGGKAQLLPNGGWMITEPTAGRVFEIDQNGRTVWEWGQDHRGDMVLEVLEGSRYPLTPEQVRAWTAR